MKITETQRVAGSTPVKGHAPRDAVTSTDTAGRTPRDSASIMGIPADELSPNVQQAVMTLMAEVDRLKRDLENSRERMRELEDMADQDPLVPVLNRRAFMRELERAMSYAKRYGGIASVIYLDLDGFKQINDVHGHAAGDAVLRAVVELLLANTRQSDVIGRIGGDEFAVILMQTPIDLAMEKAKSLLRLVRELKVAFEDRIVQPSATAGLSSIDDGEDATEVLAQADLAMYANKTGSAASET